MAESVQEERAAGQEELGAGEPVAGLDGPLFANVLCAVDGKEGGFAAVEQAAAFTGPEGRLTLLVVTSHRHAGEYRSPAIGPVSAQHIVERARKIAESAGVSTDVVVEPATPPARVVLDWAARHDLLAIGAPSASWLGGMVVAGVGDSALGSFVTPLLAARPGDGVGDVYRHVLVASDGLDDSEQPIEIAGAIARTHGSKVTLLHALGHVHKHARERVLEQGRAIGLAAREAPEVLLQSGGAHELILRSVEKVAPSLVVVGSRRRAGVRALGSVSRRVVHEAACSVLLVAPR
jgi:nucleotide-binding universal stress UspA family protein